MSIFIKLSSIKNISSIGFLKNTKINQYNYLNIIKLYNTSHNNNNNNNNNINNKKIKKQKMNLKVGEVLSNSLLNMESHKSSHPDVVKPNNNRVIVISGATSVGKSAVARQFCKRVDAEIILGIYLSIYLSI
jgi:2-phosphoglycerate kinase